MEVKDGNKRVRLSVEVEPNLHRRVKIAATRRDMTLKDYVVRVLEGIAEEEEEARGGGSVDLARLSAAVFARDWESEEDAVYDGLS